MHAACHWIQGASDARWLPEALFVDPVAGRLIGLAVNTTIDLGHHCAWCKPIPSLSSMQLNCRG
jgi:hypothetical protein